MLVYWSVKHVKKGSHIQLWLKWSILINQQTQLERATFPYARLSLGPNFNPTYPWVTIIHNPVLNALGLLPHANLDELDKSLPERSIPAASCNGNGWNIREVNMLIWNLLFWCECLESFWFINDIIDIMSALYWIFFSVFCLWISISIVNACKCYRFDFPPLTSTKNHPSQIAT